MQSFLQQLGCHVCGKSYIGIPMQEDDVADVCIDCRLKYEQSIQYNALDRGKVYTMYFNPCPHCNGNKPYMASLSTKDWQDRWFAMMDLQHLDTCRTRQGGTLTLYNNRTNKAYIWGHKCGVRGNEGLQQKGNVDVDMQKFADNVAKQKERESQDLLHGEKLTRVKPQYKTFESPKD